jgi:hypothetical protein
VQDTVRLENGTVQYSYMPLAHRRAVVMRTVLLASLAAASCGAVGRTHLFGSVRPPKDGERAEPRVKLSCGVKPCIKLRKSIEALGTTLSFGADYHVREKEAHFETTWHDPRLGGQLSLRDLSTLEWRKTWLFPGIADAATRVEVRSTLDLQTAQPDVRLKLGLRRSFASSGMSFVQDVPLDGADGHCKVAAARVGPGLGQGWARARVRPRVGPEPGPVSGSGPRVLVRPGPSYSLPYVPARCLSGPRSQCPTSCSSPPPTCPPSSGAAGPPTCLCSTRPTWR